jgi:DNA polymerase III alpha subunit (gram-positive type)
MWFKKKEEEKNWIEIMVEYIAEARRLGWEDKDIRNKFKNENYPDEIIEVAFNIIRMKGGVNMSKKEKYEDEEDEEVDLDDEQDEEEEEEEEEEKPKKKEVKEEKVPEKKQVTNEQMIQAIMNIETRVTALEGALFRIKSQI